MTTDSAEIEIDISESVALVIALCKIQTTEYNSSPS